MENKLIRKSLSLLIIIFFIAISFSPCITAEIKQCDNNTEVFKYKISIYGLYGKDEYDVILTKEEKTDLDNLLVEIDTKLHNSKSIENSKSIYNWAIQRFNDLNLLKDYTVEEVYNLTVGNVKKRQLTDEVNKDISTNNITENKNCLIKGNLTTFYFLDGVPPWVKNIYGFVERVFGKESIITAIVYYLSVFLATYYLFWRGELWDAKIVMGDAGYGRDDYGQRYYFENSCPVDLWSDGDYGIVEWAGKFWGQVEHIYIKDYYGTGLEQWWWIGIKDYSGLSIKTIEDYNSYYLLGNAYHIALSPEKYPE